MAEDAFWDLIDHLEKSGETAAYQKWKKKNVQFASKLGRFVDRFYKKRRSVPPKNMVIRIRLYDNDAKIRLYNGKSDKEIMDRLRLKKKFPSVSQKQQFRIHLRENRVHFQEFNEFLKALL